MREGTAGVIYCKDGTEGWTPVTKRRSKSRRKYVRGNSDDDEMWLPDGASISYVNSAGTPGHTRNTRSWQPIAARTRKKLGTN